VEMWNQGEKGGRGKPRGLQREAFGLAIKIEWRVSRKGNGERCILQNAHHGQGLQLGNEWFISPAKVPIAGLSLGSREVQQGQQCFWSSTELWCDCRSNLKAILKKKFYFFFHYISLNYYQDLTI
jgi:hypothetical protein